MLFVDGPFSLDPLQIMSVQFLHTLWASSASARGPANSSNVACGILTLEIFWGQNTRMISQDSWLMKGSKSTFIPQYSYLFRGTLSLP